jgi:hypothetical protein
MCYDINNMEERPFVTSGEIVRMANVHPNTVSMWRATKKIVPKDKIGSSFLYDRKEVMTFLEERQRKIEERKKENG